MVLYKKGRIKITAALLVAAMIVCAAALPVFGASENGDRVSLIPGGMTFGVQLQTKGVLVIALSALKESGICPAKDAGIEVGDIIYEVNGKAVNSSDEFTGMIEQSGGRPLDIAFSRGGRRERCRLTPEKSGQNGVYKAGLWIRDSTAGIGTVTFIEKDSGRFAGLGHGICDPDTGVLMPLLKGRVSGVTVSGIKKGKPGAPGELRGYFNARESGELTKNHYTGVYGLLSRIPSDLSAPLPAAHREEVERGEAFIICTASDNTVEKYSARIVRIVDMKNENKNFIIELTDPRLLELTGGIVQGMSGSPVIQNGMIVGAVTHVMINDPKQGYGIFIENMLDNMP